MIPALDRIESDIDRLSLPDQLWLMERLAPRIRTHTIQPMDIQEADLASMARRGTGGRFGQLIRALVYKRATWILTRADEGVLHPKPKLFVSGETLPYLGREVRMDVTEGEVAAVRIRFNHWTFDVTVPSRLDGDERWTAIRSAFVKWYRRRAADAVRRSVARWSEHLPVTPKGAVIRDQRQRWGSCGPDGMLRFNWRIVMSDPALLDYVVVHELAHLVHRNHSRELLGHCGEGDA